jgi:hypothetical protein
MNGRISLSRFCWSLASWQLPKVRQEESPKKYNQQNLRSLLNEIIYLLSTHYIGFISLLPIAPLGALVKLVAHL